MSYDITYNIIVTQFSTSSGARLSILFHSDICFMAFVVALLLIGLAWDVLSLNSSCGGSVALDVVDEGIWSSSVSLLEISKGYNFKIGQVIL